MADPTYDVFSKMTPFRWRGIPFSTESFSVQLAQDHAEHKFPGVDGAFVEATGRAPLVFSAKVLFRNGDILRAKKWELEDNGAKYPHHYRKFFAACADKSTGNLEHPELGPVPCKCKSANTQYQAERRDGVTVDVVWVESIDKDVEDFKPNPIPAFEFAVELDSEVAQYKIVRPDKPLTSISFSDLMFKLRGIFDRVSLLQKQIVGKIAMVIHEVSKLIDACVAAKDPKVYPIIHSAQRLRTSLEDFQGVALHNTKAIKIYPVRYPQTLSSIASTIGHSVIELMELNPELVLVPVIPAGKAVRYYASSSSITNFLLPIPQASP